MRRPIDGSVPRKRRHKYRYSWVFVGVLASLLMAVPLHNERQPGGTQNGKPRVEQIRWGVGQEDGRRHGLLSSRVWSAGPYVYVLYDGKVAQLKLSQNVQRVDWYGSPGADLTAVTADRAYALSLHPNLHQLYSYPNPVNKYDRIIVDKSENMLFYYKTGRLVSRYPVATGRLGNYTPEGVFRITVKLRDKDGPVAGNPRLGQRWMGLAVPNQADKRGPENDLRAPAGQKYGIHGTNEPESIGKRTSGGCIRMRDRDVAKLFDQVAVGIIVEVRA